MNYICLFFGHHRACVSLRWRVSTGWHGHWLCWRSTGRKNGLTRRTHTPNDDISTPSASVLILYLESHKMCDVSNYQVRVREDHAHAGLDTQTHSNEQDWPCCAWPASIKDANIEHTGTLISPRHRTQTLFIYNCCHVSGTKHLDLEWNRLCSGGRFRLPHQIRGGQLLRVVRIFTMKREMSKVPAVFWIVSLFLREFFYDWWKIPGRPVMSSRAKTSLFGKKKEIKNDRGWCWRQSVTLYWLLTADWVIIFG